MPVFNTYNYEPLSAPETIRLIDLDPAADKNAPLTCQIVQHRLSDQHLEYSAVSYSWGRHSRSQTLEVKFEDDVLYLRITPNVDALLQQLRSSTKSRYLWLDAVCLNQHDVLEKAAQVPMMGEIYKLAKTVEIWLGPESRSITDLLAFFKALSTIPDVRRWKSQRRMAKRISAMMRQFFGGFGSALKAIMEFFQRPWFLRRWVIQEAYLARHAVMYCGSQSISNEVVALASARFQRMGMSDYAIKMMASLGSRASQPGILELLWDFDQAECLEKRDRIAALWSLVHPANRFELNYNKPWTEIYRNLAFSMH